MFDVFCSLTGILPFFKIHMDMKHHCWISQWILHDFPYLCQFSGGEPLVMEIKRHCQNPPFDGYMKHREEYIYIYITTKNKSDTTIYVGQVFFRMLSPNQNGNLNNSTIFTFLTQTRCEKMGVEAATKITGVHSKPAVCQTCSVKHKYTVLSQNMDPNVLYFIII